MSSSDDLVTAEELALYAERQRVQEEQKPRKRKNVKRVGTRVERIVARALDAIPRVRARRIPGSGGRATWLWSPPKHRRMYEAVGDWA